MSDIVRIDWNSIERKWIRRWEEERLFEADPDEKRKKYFLTVAYPYPNSPQHIGHGRTYTLADAHARYMRMKGCNVLFPMGFHYTGTPILAMSRRVAEGDSDLLNTFRTVYKLSDEVIKTFAEPIKIAKYFHSEIKQGMKEMGYSIDWRREFTTVDPMYSKFISWQFRTLQKKGLIVQGSHPVGWCPRDQNPVSQHDTLGDVEPDFNEYTVVKFKSEELVLPVATLRPETVLGVTNMWVNPETEYVQAIVDGEKWVLSKEAARKLAFLNRTIVVEKTVEGKELIGKIAVNPINGSSVPVYPATFVQADSGTGLVMSVPAHAPYDFQALEDLRHDKNLQRQFGISSVAEAIKIIQSEGYEGIPAAEAVRKAGVSNQEDEKLEKTTSELYSHEFYKGRMMQNTGRYAGMTVSVAKNEIKAEIMQGGNASVMYELVNKPVRCRCGTECVVKLLSDQWFLNYGDKHWKDLAHECAKTMEIVPEDIRQEFLYVIDWLRERACARKSGLGTILPWDPDWIIESLSDSVIYMAYYIISKYVSDSFSGYKITDAFFDYVLLGRGNPNEISRECHVPSDMLDRIRNEFAYFYPVDSRHSGRDLVPNHLTFFIFSHAAIFDRKNWPGQIVVNGSVLMTGKKMSKSLGNIIPLREAIREHGADAIRLAMLMSAEILQDFDWSFETVRGIRSKLSGILQVAARYQRCAQLSELELEDRWLISRLQRTISETAASMDRLRTREAIHTILYSLDQDLQWYLKRATAKGRENTAWILRELLDVQVRMLTPFAPFTCEEAWQRMGNKELVASMAWPEVRQERIDPAAEESEFLVSTLLADMQNILKVTKMVPAKIAVYTSAGWKLKIYESILNSILKGKTNFGEIMKHLLAGEETARVKTDPKLVQKIIEDILSAPLEARSRRLNLDDFAEKTAIQDASSLLSSEMNNAKIIVYSEEDPSKYDPKGKARSARPFKPAVYME